jgi:intein/homing endonuclease
MKDKIIDWLNDIGLYTKGQFEVLVNANDSLLGRVRSCQKEKALFINELSIVKDELKVLEKNNEQCEQEIAELQEELSSREEENELEQYWNNKYSKTNVLYPGRSLPYSTTKCKVPVNILITPDDQTIHTDLKRWGLYNSDEDVERLVPKIYRKISTEYYKYEFDRNVWGSTEVWEFPFELREKGFRQGFDCLTGDTNVWTKEGLKRIDSLEVGDKVLSYNFDNQSVEEKEIINFWDKGLLPVNKVRFFGGLTIKATDDHKFYFRSKEGYNKKRLVEHDVTKSKNNCQNKVPEVIEIPHKIKDIGWLTPELCKLVGYYIAEGWGTNQEGKKSKFICGKGVWEFTEIMDKNNINYTVQKPNQAGVPQVLIRLSDDDRIREVLADCGRVAKEKNIPGYLKQLPKNKLEMIFEGMMGADGTVRGNSLIYSTISEQLAIDLQDIGKRLGKPSNKFFIKECGGFNNSSIYRVDFNSKSYRLRDYGWSELSENTMLSVEKQSVKENVYDIEVKDNHNFLLENGVVVGNCDSWAIFQASYYIAAGVPRWMVRVVAGNCEYGGHATVYVYSKVDNKWHHLNSTYGRNMNKHLIKNFPTHKDAEQGNDKIGISEVWFSFNDKFAWSKFGGQYVLED